MSDSEVTYALLVSTGALHEGGKLDPVYDYELCPVCGAMLCSSWADDGEADLADWWACEEDGGCHAHGAYVQIADPMVTQNGVAVPVVDWAVEVGKREILADIADGSVGMPASFSDLHDFVDANEYALLCAEPHPFGLEGEAWIQWGSDVQDALNAWIVAGIEVPS